METGWIFVGSGQVWLTKYGLGSGRVHKYLICCVRTCKAVTIYGLKGNFESQKNVIKIVPLNLATHRLKSGLRVSAGWHIGCGFEGRPGSSLTHFHP